MAATSTPSGPSATSRQQSWQQRLEAAAGRLRMVQLDLAGHDADGRKSLLLEEIRTATAGLAPEQRKQFLDELQEFFPSWDAQVYVAARADEKATGGGDLDDPVFLATRLAQTLGKASDGTRRAALDALGAAGLQGSGSVPEAVAKEIRAKLQVPETQSLDPAKLAELLAVLVDFCAIVDTTSWNVWKTIAPQSQVRNAQPLARTLGKYLTGDPATTRQTLGADVLKLRQLLAGLIGAIPRTGGFACTKIRQMAPSEVKAVVDQESMFPNNDKYWRKYTEVYAGFDEVAFDREMRQAIAGYAEQFFRNPAAAAPR